MSDVFEQLAGVIAARREADPGESYVASLYAKGRPAIAAKVGEEAAETIVAALAEDDAALVHEAADLWFHVLVLLAERGLGPAEVEAELARRFGISGHEEKKGRGSA